MKYQRAVREFLKSKLNAVSADEFATFAQAYGADRTKAVNTPTRKRLDATLASVKSTMLNSPALAVPVMGRGSFKKSGAVSNKRPAKLAACR